MPLAKIHIIEGFRRYDDTPDRQSIQAAIQAALMNTLVPPEDFY